MLPLAVACPGLYLVAVRDTLYALRFVDNVNLFIVGSTST